MSGTSVIKQLRRLRRFQSAFLIGSVSLYVLCIAALVTRALKGQTIHFSDPIAVLSIVGSVIWLCLGLGLSSAFGRQVPTDEDN